MDASIGRTSRQTVGILALLALLATGSGCGVIEHPGGDTRGDPRSLTNASGTPVPGVTPACAAHVSSDPESPELDVQERLELAYPPADFGMRSSRGTGHDLSRAIYGEAFDWPEMHYLGEEAQISGVAIQPVEIRIVRGDTIPLAYSPERDETAPAPEGAPRELRGQLTAA